ncbi:MAG TPA: T9SS type A sorting domain-containing protein [Bacteroidia bacterium]|nr:T9SS type A sorting domain-containing protein [Bacteroidia bacterium]
MKKITFVLSLLWVLGQDAVAQYAWNNMGLGTNLAVYTLEADTANKILYLGGTFTQAGGAPSVGIAKWNGVSYSPVGLGIVAGTGVYSTLIQGTDLIAGGTFTNIGGVSCKNIAKWNGSSWSPLGAGLDSLTGLTVIKSLAVYQNELYAGGIFSNSGGTQISNIAKWNGTSWQPVGTGINGVVAALCVYKNELYAGGNFTTAGGVPVKNIARWDNTNWHNVNGGVNYTGAISICALQVYSGQLYAGGTFDTAGVIHVNNIARWDSTNWSNVGGGAINYTGAISICAFTNYSGGIVTGGSFDTLGAIPANFIGSWNNTNWSTFSTGMNNTVYALETMGDTLYAGGVFTTAGGITSAFVSQWKPGGVMHINSEYLQKAIKVYPNPSCNAVYFVLGNELKTKGDINIMLLDALGREVSKAEHVKGACTMERKNISAGLYFYRITGEDNSVLQEGKIIFTD